MESALYGIFTLVNFVSESHSFAALTRSISDTSPTRVKIPYARAFHEVMSMSLLVFSPHLFFFRRALTTRHYDSELHCKHSLSLGNRASHSNLKRGR